jgi:Super-infection exclusion protein B
MDITKLVEFIKLPMTYIFGFALISGTLLFANESILIHLGIKEFVQKYKMWIGLSFIVSLGLLIPNVLLNIWRNVQRGIKHRRIIRLRKEKLRNLTPEEKIILSKYFKDNTKTCYFSITDGRIRELEFYKIIYRASNVGWGGSFAYNIQPWAWDYLKEHPELLHIEIDYINM